MAKQHINDEIEYSVRANQAALQYGPGAMIDFKDQTLMTASPARWAEQIRRINDKRLQERLKVSYFGVPQTKKDKTGQNHGITFVRFPEWYYCPNCGDFKPLSEWKKDFEKCTTRNRYEQNDIYMLKYIRCYNPKCKKRPLVVSRFIRTCSDGHIDNFPWNAFVHYSNDVEPCANPKFKVDVNSRSDSLEGIKITCTVCKNSATMSRILDPKTMETLKKRVEEKFGKAKAEDAFGCTGRHPWKFEKQYSKNCQKPMNVVIRGSSSVYFPVSVSSIVIPSYADKIEAIVKDRDLFTEFEVKFTEKYTDFQASQNQTQTLSAAELQKLADEKKQMLISIGIPEATITNDMLMKAVENDLQKKAQDGLKDYTDAVEKLVAEYSEAIAKAESNLSEAQVEKVLRDFINKASNPQVNVFSSTDADFEYKEAEFKALNGEDKKFGLTDEFIREQIPIEKYNRKLLPAVKGISLITSLREVQALVGYSRQFPVSFTDELYAKTDEDILYNGANSPNNTSAAAGTNGTTDGTNHSSKIPKLVKINEGQKWFPGYEIRGEGIFIELDADRIAEWEKQDVIKARAGLLNKNYARSFTGKTRPDRHIKAGFVLIHTLSHLLMNQVSFDCGYNVASLKERIYYGINSDGIKRAGILIYTGGDSEGSLGGLVRLGRPDVFPRIFDKALKSARFCSNDPVCSCSSGQGRESLNLAACHSCVLLPETCCEEFNVFLDRGMLAGTFEEDGDFGFFDSFMAETTGGDDDTDLRGSSDGNAAGQSDGKSGDGREGENNPVQASSEASVYTPEQTPAEEYLTKYQRGSSLGDYSFEEIFNEEDGEIEVESEEDKKFFAEVLKEIKSSEEDYIGIEKPIIECKLLIGNSRYDDVIIWPQSGFAYFLSDIADKVGDANQKNRLFKCINHKADVKAFLNDLK